MREPHDDLEHWDVKETHQFVPERFQWLKMRADVIPYVKISDLCQRMQNVQPYVTNRLVPHFGLFYVFSIDFSAPLATTKESNRFILVCVEHLNGCPIVKGTKNAKASVVIPFMEEDIISPFCAMEFVISDNVGCFSAPALTTYMKD